MPMRAARATVLAMLGCGAGERPVARAEPADAPVHDPEPPTVAIELSFAERFPSLAFYPSVDAGLHDALIERAPPRELLFALAETLAPYRWDDVRSWDNQGFVATEGAPVGFVTRRGGEVVAQDPGRFDLGCAGGFLEGVRMVLLPTLELHELARCEPGLTERVGGAPRRCGDPAHFGWIAVANLASRLDDARLPAGRTLVELDPAAPDQLVALREPGAAHLCTVSHTSLVHRGRRFHHHMMIVLGTGEDDAYDVFDTTGSRGVAMQRMDGVRFDRYCTGLLAANRDYRYAPASARMICLRVAL